MDIEEQYDKIFHYCYYRIRDKNVAEDITQEVFLRFYTSNYVEQQKEIRYLYTIARNLCIDEYRKRNIYKSQIEQLERRDGTGQTGKAESDGGAFAETIIEKLSWNRFAQSIMECRNWKVSQRFRFEEFTLQERAASELYIL